MPALAHGAGVPRLHAPDPKPPAHRQHPVRRGRGGGTALRQRGARGAGHAIFSAARGDRSERLRQPSSQPRIDGRADFGVVHRQDGERTVEAHLEVKREFARFLDPAGAWSLRVVKTRAREFAPRGAGKKDAAREDGRRHGRGSGYAEVELHVPSRRSVEQRKAAHADDVAAGVGEGVARLGRGLASEIGEVGFVERIEPLNFAREGVGQPVMQPAFALRALGFLPPGERHAAEEQRRGEAEEGGERKRWGGEAHGGTTVASCEP